MTDRHLRPLNWIQWVTLACVAALAAVTPIVLYRLDSVSRNQTATLRTLVCFFEKRTLQNPTLTPAQRQQAITVYGQALDAIHAERCP